MKFYTTSWPTRPTPKDGICLEIAGPGEIESFFPSSALKILFERFQENHLQILKPTKVPYVPRASKPSRVDLDSEITKSMNVVNADMPRTLHSTSHNTPSQEHQRRLALELAFTPAYLQGFMGKSNLVWSMSTYMLDTQKAFNNSLAEMIATPGISAYGANIFHLKTRTDSCSTYLAIGILDFKKLPRDYMWISVSTRYITTYKDGTGKLIYGPERLFFGGQWLPVLCSLFEGTQLDVFLSKRFTKQSLPANFASLFIKKAKSIPKRVKNINNIIEHCAGLPDHIKSFIKKCLTTPPTGQMQPDCYATTTKHSGLTTGNSSAEIIKTLSPRSHVPRNLRRTGRIASKFNHMGGATGEFLAARQRRNGPWSSLEPEHSELDLCSRNEHIVGLPELPQGPPTPSVSTAPGYHQHPSSPSGKPRVALTGPYAEPHHPPLFLSVSSKVHIPREIQEYVRRTSTMGIPDSVSNEMGLTRDQEVLSKESRSVSLPPNFFSPADPARDRGDESPGKPSTRPPFVPSSQYPPRPFPGITIDCGGRK